MSKVKFNQDLLVSGEWNVMSCAYFVVPRNFFLRKSVDTFFKFFCLFPKINKKFH